VLRTEELTKQFGSTVAVQDLNLHIRPGEIYGFLGPNGAGKTTTIFMMLGLVKPTKGQVLLFGHPVSPDTPVLKRGVGVVAEEAATATQMTGWELVHFFADLNGVQRPEHRMQELFEVLDLWEARHGLVREYSRGMRQKLSLIRALVHEPALLVLDEPVSGLDPYGIRQVRDVVEQHRAKGGSAFISSHILSEIERSADRIGILHHGRLLVEDTIDGLRRKLQQGSSIRLTFAHRPPELLPALEALSPVERIATNGTSMVVHTRGSDDARSLIFETVVAHGGVLVDMRTDEMTLEEAFVTITNQNVEQLAGGA
jgi:ABC-type multidrug transport system ATPase subunit